LRVITPSRWLKDRIVRSGIDERRISVIPNPVDSKVFCPGARATARSHFGVAVGAFVVGFVAANVNDPMKNLVGLVENLCLTQEKYPELPLTLLVVGKGKVNGKSLNVVYLNEIESIEDRVFAYQSMDVLVNYSFAESWSLVSAEALSCGIPVVASKIGGVVDVIRDGQNGFLLNSEAEIAPTLYSLFSDQSLTQRLGHSARQTAITEFDVEMVLQMHYELYRQMVEV
jgi:glycosyltransferase involved in cell wall biosynthesis